MNYLKWFGIVILSIVLFSNGAQVEASDEENSILFSKKQYDVLVNEGILDSEINYEAWAEMMKEDHGQTIEDEGIFPAQTVYPAFTKMLPGDIFITSSASSAGLVGHAAIAISETAILHIAGPNKTTSIMSYGKWKETYAAPGKHTWIYRFSDRSLANSAANWTRRNYWNKNGGSQQDIFPGYLINMNTFGTNPTYCSKIVYQAYSRSDHNLLANPGLVISPYSLRGDRAGSLWKTTKKPQLVATITN